MKQLLCAVLACSACKKKATEDKPAAPPPAAPAVADAAEAKPPAAAPWDGKSPLKLEGFQTPESVLYDADDDVYLVSNINGKPLDADDNGFISKVTPEGKISELKWIDGAKDNIKLDAPKGMAIANGTLYVADITVVRQFDLKTGAPKPDIKIDGATFLNDMAPAKDGGVYVTDSGLDPSFKPTGTDAVFAIDKAGKVKPLIKNKDLGGPNGVIADDKGAVWVVTFRSGELYSIDAKGKQSKPEKLPKGQLDGVVALDGGDLLVSSWEGSSVFRGKPGGEWKPVVENVPSPADIGWDNKRQRLLIPNFQGNAIQLQSLP